MKKNIFWALCIILAGSVYASNTTNYTSSSTYTVPSDVGFILIEAWGAGGGGGGTSNNNAGGGGGAGGGSYSATYTTVTPGENLTITVGSGGAGGIANDITAPGGTGGNSSVNSSTTIFVLATGGTGGNPQGFGGGGGGGGGGAGGMSTSNTGSVRFSGGNGTAGSTGAGQSGGGGGGSGNAANGGNASGATGGTGGTSGGGNGANGVAADGAGVNGSNIGGAGSGAYCDGTCAGSAGGSGARGEVRITAYSNSTNNVIIYVRDVNTLSLVSSMNVTLQSPESFAFYNYSSTTGVVVAENITSGTYLVTISASGYDDNYAALTMNSNSSQSATYYVDSNTDAINFFVYDTLGVAVTNATATFSRNINGSIQSYAQKISDFSGYFSVNLNPAGVYSLLITDPSGLRIPFSGTVINPSSALTYTINMELYASSGYNYSANNTYTKVNATYNNTSKTINVTWEVINSAGGLDWLFVSTLYNGTTYSQNISSVGGGIATVLVTGVNLTFQDSINVTAIFKNTGHTSVSNIYPFQFIDYTVGNQSITGGLFNTGSTPSSLWGKAVLGTIILIITIAGAYSFTGNPEFAALVGAVVTGMLSVPSVGLFPLLAGLITVAVVSVVLMSKVIR